MILFAVQIINLHALPPIWSWVVPGCVLFVLMVIAFFGAPYGHFLEIAKSRCVRNLIIFFLKITKRDDETYMLAGNPHLDRDEFDRILVKYLENKNRRHSVMWRLAENVSTPVDILGQLSGDGEYDSEIAVRELLLAHKGVPDDVKTLWALKWGGNPGTFFG